MSISSTTFQYSAGAVSAMMFEVKFDMIVQNSSFIHNYASQLFTDRRLSLSEIEDGDSGAGFKIHKVPNREQEQVFIRFINVLFRNNTSSFGGAVEITSTSEGKARRNLNITFYECQFMDNQALNGGAFLVRHKQKIYVPQFVSNRDYFGSEMIKTHSRPVSNRNNNGGEMINAHLEDGALYLDRCIFERNKATETLAGKRPQITDLYNQNTGGAMFCFDFQIYITESTMINNYASYSGGTLFDIGCAIILNKPTIRIDGRMTHLPMDSQAIYSGGLQLMTDVKIEIQQTNIRIKSPSYIWVIGITTYKPDAMPGVIPRRVNLICPTGNDIDCNILPVKAYGKAQRLIQWNKVRFRCLPCPTQFYSLDNGREILQNVSSRKKQNIKCMPCPYGGDCSKGIKAKAHFWGYRSEVQGVYIIKFLPCQRGYCCQGKNCVTYDSCNENRQGILCARCRKGYVQGLSSSKCIKVSKCGNPLIWPIIILGGVAYLIFLMHFSEIACVVKRMFCGKKKILSRVLDDDGSVQIQNTHLRKNPNQTFVFSSLIKVVFFFFQIEPLVRVEQNTSNKSKFFHMAQTFHSIYSAILNFQLGFSCPLKVESPVINRLLFTSFPILLLIILGMISICHSIIKLFKKSTVNMTENQPNNALTAFKVRLVSCTVNVILLTYATISKTTLALLNCVKINQIRVLYLDGTITCYNTWQYVITAFATVFIFPLPVGLHIATRKLKTGHLTVSQFLFQMFLPIFSITSAFGSYIQSLTTRNREVIETETRNICQLSEQNQRSLELHQSDQDLDTIINESTQNQEAPESLFEEFSKATQHPYDYLESRSQENLDQPTHYLPVSSSPGYQRTNSSASSQENIPANHDSVLDAVLKVTDSPFSREHGQYNINWESILIGRRLILILIFTFVPYPTLRIILMLITCFIMILHSAYANPYTSDFVNKCEVISLLLLEILCLTNILVAFGYESNAHLTGYLTYFSQIFFWIETLLVDIIPATILLTVATVILLRLLLSLCILLLQGVQFLASKISRQGTEDDEGRYFLDES